MEIKYYNIMIDARNFFDQPIKNDLKTYNIRTIATGQGDDCTTECLLDYPYFKKYHKLFATYLSKQQKLGADLKAILQINFTGNLSRAEGTAMFFIIEEAKKCFVNIWIISSNVNRCSYSKKKSLITNYNTNNFK